LGLALAAVAVRGAEKAAEKPFTLIGFIKPFQNFSYSDIADISQEIGWGGIEIPVRKGGTIEPARVEEELPKILDALKARGLSLPIIATDVEDAADPLARKVLKIARQLGVTRYRIKHLLYDLNKPIPPQLENFRSKLRDLAHLNQELKIQGTIQNHSGRNYLGAPVWDIWELIRDLDPKDMGAYFDIGHATVEGGSSWPLEAKLIEPHLAMISVKDFTWVKSNKNPGEPYQAEWCPLGQGMVSPKYFEQLKKTNFNGLISQHFEYPLGSRKEMTEAMKKDLKTLKTWLA